MQTYNKGHNSEVCNAISPVIELDLDFTPKSMYRKILHLKACTGSLVKIGWKLLQLESGNAKNGQIWLIKGP